MIIIRVIKKFESILSAHQKIHIMKLAILMIIGGLLETCSVSLILVFVNGIMKSDEIMDKWYIKIICNIFRIESAKYFIIFSAIIMAIVYVFKNIYLLIEYNIQYKFVYENMFDMQKRLLQSFINRPYEYFLSIDSGEVIRIVSSDTNNAFGLLTTLLMLLTESVVSAMLVMTVFIMTPKISVCVAILLIVMLLSINLVIKPILRKAALNNQESFAGMNKWLLQSIQGIKEIKVLNKEDFFQKNYDRYGRIYVSSLRKNQIYGMMPRFIIEAISMSVMFIVLAITIYNGQDIKEALPLLTAVITAAIRLLPSINRISSSLANITYNEPMLDKMIENLKNVETDIYIWNNGKSGENNGLHLQKTKTNIYFNRISYKYPNSDKEVLKEASMIIHRGESIGIIGTSGAGKSTVVDIIMGLLYPQEGQIIVDGIDIKKNMKEWRKQIGYIPQTIFMLDDTIRANIAFGETKEDILDSDIWEALKEAALDVFVKSMPEGLDTSIGERGVRLSGGQRQRIGIARALYRNPEILIFDEATSALDDYTESAIMESIKKLKGKKTMIIITHRLTTIQHCDHIYRIENSNISMER